MALFFVGYVRVNGLQAYRIVDSFSRESRVYAEDQIKQGLLSGVNVANLYVTNNKVETRGNNYPTSNVGETIDIGRPVTVIAKDSANNIYMIANCLGTTNLCRLDNIRILYKSNKLTNITVVEDKYTRALAGIEIPELDLGKQIKMYETTELIGCFGVLNAKGEASLVKVFDPKDNKIKEVSSASKKIPLDLDITGCEPGYYRFSRLITPIPKEFVFSRKTLPKKVILLRTITNKGKEVSFSTVHTVISEYDHAENYVSLTEIIGNLIEKTGKFLARYAKNEAGDIRIETLTDSIIIDRSTVEVKYNQYKKDIVASRNTENILSIMANTDIEIDSTGKLTRVIRLPEDKFITPKNVNCIADRAFANVEVDNQDKLHYKWIQYLELSREITNIDSSKSRLRSNMGAETLVVKSEAILKDLNILNRLTFKKLRLYGDEHKIAGWDHVLSEYSYYDVLVNDKKLGHLSEEVQRKIEAETIKVFKISRTISLCNTYCKKLRNQKLWFKNKDASGCYARMFVSQPNFIYEPSTGEDSPIRQTSGCTNALNMYNIEYNFQNAEKIIEKAYNTLDKHEITTRDIIDSKTRECKELVEDGKGLLDEYYKTKVFSKIPSNNKKELRQIFVYSEMSTVEKQACIKVVMPGVAAERCVIHDDNGSPIYGVYSHTTRPMAIARTKVKSYEISMEDDTSAGIQYIKKKIAEMIQRIQKRNPEIEYIVTPQEQWASRSYTRCADEKIITGEYADIFKDGKEVCYLMLLPE